MNNLPTYLLKTPELRRDALLGKRIRLQNAANLTSQTDDDGFEAPEAVRIRLDEPVFYDLFDLSENQPETDESFSNDGLLSSVETEILSEPQNNTFAYNLYDSIAMILFRHTSEYWTKRQLQRHIFDLKLAAGPNSHHVASITDIKRHITDFKSRAGIRNVYFCSRCRKQLHSFKQKCMVCLPIVNANKKKYNSWDALGRPGSPPCRSNDIFMKPNIVITFASIRYQLLNILEDHADDFVFDAQETDCRSDLTDFEAFEGNAIHLIVSVDGVQPLQNSRRPFTPISFAIVNLPGHLRIRKHNLVVAAITFGEKSVSKPTWKFCIDEIQSQLEDISSNPITVKWRNVIKQVCVKVSHGTLDIIANQNATSLASHSSKRCSCHFCTVKGAYVACGKGGAVRIEFREHVLSQTNWRCRDYTKREDWEDFADPSMPFNSLILPDRLRFEDLHGVSLGIVSKLVELVYIEGKYRLASHHLGVISDIYQAAGSVTYIATANRCLGEYKSFNGHERRYLFDCTAPFVALLRFDKLGGCLYLIWVVLRILSSTHIDKATIELAVSTLQSCATALFDVFGATVQTLKIHHFTVHLAQQATTVGLPIDFNSSVFEALFRELKYFVHPCQTNGFECDLLLRFLCLRDAKSHLMRVRRCNKNLNDLCNDYHLAEPQHSPTVVTCLMQDSVTANALKAIGNVDNLTLFSKFKVRGVSIITHQAEPGRIYKFLNGREVIFGEPILAYCSEHDAELKCVISVHNVIRGIARSTLNRYGSTVATAIEKLRPIDTYFVKVQKYNDKVIIVPANAFLSRMEVLRLYCYTYFVDVEYRVSRV